MTYHSLDSKSYDYPGKLCLSSSHNMTEYEMSGEIHTGKRVDDDHSLMRPQSPIKYNIDHVDFDYPIIYTQASNGLSNIACSIWDKLGRNIQTLAKSIIQGIGTPLF